MNNENYDVLNPGLAINSMRSSGFKSTDHAISELIDNSIQSGLAVNDDATNVEVITIEEPFTAAARQVYRISEIITYDNAAGMSPELLRRSLMFGQGSNLEKKNQKGMGKFGMGLPNASISQCKWVEVYSWQNSEVYYTYTSVDELNSGKIRQVHQPIKKSIPDFYLKAIKSDIGPSGTIVVWKQLDKTTWNRHKAFFRASEWLIGRMYRRFINDERVQIRFAAFRRDLSGQFDFLEDMYVRPNDPLMLMKNTSAPGKYGSEAAFSEWGVPQKLSFHLPDGTKSSVIICYSMARKEVRLDGTRDAGHSDLGKYVAKNLGVSVVRAGRELEMNRTWNNPTESSERWWSIEVEFQPELDEILGVSNDKQAATNLFAADYENDADLFGIRPSELMEHVRETGDLKKQVNYEISDAIFDALKVMRKEVKDQTSGSRNARKQSEGDAELIATRMNKIRAEEKTTQTDIDFDTSTADQKRAENVNFLTKSGYDDEDAKIITERSIEASSRYMFTEQSLPSSVFFDVHSVRGIRHIRLNTDHLAYPHFIKLLSTEEDETPALVGLKLLLTAWARMEDEAKGQTLSAIQETREDWGRMAKRFLSEYSGDE